MVGPPEPPENLFAEAREAWAYLAPMLHEAGILDRADLPMFQSLCALLGRAEQARKAVGDDLFVEGSHGGLVVHPATRLERQSIESASRLAALFGMSPSDRARIGLQTIKKRRMSEELDRLIGIPNNRRTDN